jgi:3-dehydroquinate dehydratase-2
VSHRIVVLNGPNLGGTLGVRQPHLYGSATFAELTQQLHARAAVVGCSLHIEQSNHEGGLIDILESERGSAQGCIINPGGLSHTSIALLDALLDFGAPVIEVHISNIHAREDFRRVSITAQAATALVSGFGTHGYLLALDGLCNRLGSQETT